MHERRQFNVQDVRIVLDYFGSSVSDETLVSTLETFRQLLLAAKRDSARVMCIVECHESYSMGPRQRQIQANWKRSVAELTRATTIGNCFVMHSVVARGIITAVAWFEPHVVPTHVCGSLADGLIWAFERCEEAGVSMPQQVRDDCHASLWNARTPKQASASR